MVLLFLALAACSSTPDIHPQSQNLVLLLPGVGGDAPVYAHAMECLATHGNNDHLRIQNWGYRWPFLFSTIGSLQLHEQIEQQVADQIVNQLARFPDSRVVLIAHSAGAGVVLGALGKLPTGMTVGPIILLAPSMSPGFNLTPALAHARSIDIFYSSRDSFWQGIGPLLVGTYDRANCVPAGNRGFKLDSLSPGDREKVRQHPYQDEWQSLSVEGGHFDWLSPDFFATVIEPMINSESARASADKTQSSAANPR